MKPAKTSSSFSPDGSELPFGMFTSRKAVFQLSAIIVFGLTAWVWFSIISTQEVESAVYFLNVGQGDSQLIVLASQNNKSSVKILIDAGPGRKVLDALDEALGKQDNKYIDVIMMTHPELDHFGGFVDVIKNYDVGLFISNGNETDSDAFLALKTALAEHTVPMLTLAEGDTIRYDDSNLFIMSPDSALLGHKERNETGIVAKLTSEDSTVLFTADVGFPVEQVLLKKGHDISADVLKVGHHGSKYSSSESFVATVRPLVSVIGVGKNSYGHPTPRVLETLDLAGTHMYRTDQDGTVKVILSRDMAFQETRAQNDGFVALTASIMTGGYKKGMLTTISLPQIKEQGEKRVFDLVPHKECSFRRGENPAYSPILINEIAWMGAETGSTHEWIELQNVSGKSVNMSGWQVVNENERLHATFPQQTIFDGQFMILARSVANDALGLKASVVFTGSVRNSNEGLRLFDNECNLIDEVSASPSWPAGNNSTKQTMERMSDLSWATSKNAGGTPKKENTGSSAKTPAPSFTPASQTPPPTIPYMEQSRAGCAAEQININIASKDDLMKIRHIGNARADDIIANRPFSSIEELRGKVNGVGEARLADILAENVACVSR